MSSKHCDTCSCARHSATPSCQSVPTNEDPPPPYTTKAIGTKSSDFSSEDDSNYDDYDPKYYKESPICTEFIEFPRHPLIAAARKNVTYSPICGLPDSILQRTIGFLDGCSVESLRRTGRIFLRLCPLVFPENYGHPGTTPRPQLKESPDSWPNIRSDGRLQALLRKTLFCKGCREVRGKSSWKGRVDRLRTPLFCDICLDDHPSYLFSVRERHNETGLRRCIAHEGFISLCEHSEAELRLSHIGFGLHRLCTQSSHKQPPESTAEDVDIHMKGPSLHLKNFFREKDGSWSLRLGWEEHSLCTKPELLETFISFLGGRKILPSGLIKLKGLSSPTPSNFDIVYDRSAAINWWATKELEHYNSDRYPLRYKVQAKWMDCLRTALDDRDRECKATRCVREIGVYENDGVTVSREWYQALNHRSYNLRGDKDGFQVYWCNEKHCTNYYKFGLARILTKENGL